ncbi:MAG: helix-turn-helix domain-containing protein [Fusobacteriaceae bacterium]
MNRYEEMLWQLRKDMKNKKITNSLLIEKLKLAPSTVSLTLNGRSMSVENIMAICEFVKNYEPEEQQK